MAHFAKIDENNLVTQVIVVNNNELLNENSIEVEAKGIEFCQSLISGTWVQTSYNGIFRKNFAGLGFFYDKELDAFYAPNPYPSWSLDVTNCVWTPPTPVIDIGKPVKWNEDTLTWEEV